MAPVIWATRLAMHGLVLAVQRFFFTSRVMYYLYGTRVRLLALHTAQPSGPVPGL